MALSPAVNEALDAVGQVFSTTMMRAAIARLTVLGVSKAEILAGSETLVPMLRDAGAAGAGRALEAGKVLVDGGMSGWVSEPFRVEAVAAGIAAADRFHAALVVRPEILTVVA